MSRGEIPPKAGLLTRNHKAVFCASPLKKKTKRGQNETGSGLHNCTIAQLHKPDLIFTNFWYYAEKENNK